MMGMRFHNPSVTEQRIEFTFEKSSSMGNFTIIEPPGDIGAVMLLVLIRYEVDHPARGGCDSTGEIY